MADFFNNLINTLGGTQIAGLIITSVIALSAIGLFIFNGINLERKIKNDPEKAEDLSREISSCKQLLEAKQ